MQLKSLFLLELFRLYRGIIYSKGPNSRALYRALKGERIDHRDKLKAIGQGLFGILTAYAAPKAVAYALTPREAHAAEARAVTPTQPQTVEQILAGTRFREITPENYWATLQKPENKYAIVLHFDNTMANRGDGRLAEVFRDTMNVPDAQKIAFFYLVMKQGIPQKTYRKLGFQGTPSEAWYVNGKEVMNNHGGPKNEAEKVAGIKTTLQNYAELITM